MSLVRYLVSTLFFKICVCREWDSIVSDYYTSVPRFPGALSNHIRLSANTINQADVNLCISQGKKFHAASKELDELPKPEKFPNQAIHHFFSGTLSPEVESAADDSKIALFATKILQNKLKLCSTPNDFISFLENNKLINYRFEKLPRCSLLPTYRSLDGTCNNKLHPKWGAVNTPFTRLAPTSYKDGIYTMPVAKSGNPLPSARRVSSRIFWDRERSSQTLSNMVVLWGQYIAHDLSLRAMEQSATGGIQCCSTDGKQTLCSDETHSGCAAIDIPEDDPFYSLYGIRCMNYVRSVTAPALDGSLGPAQQMNTVTSYLDASPVYSTGSSQSRDLRLYIGGKLILTHDNMLMTRLVPEEGCDLSGDDSCPCYIAGDNRVNQTPPLAALQTLLAREHNRLAESLQKINPHWTDERLFQTARKILIAQIQHITYHEWLPLFISSDYLKKNQIVPNGLFSYDYDSNVNAGIINAFATGAFRFFHTLVRGDIKVCPYDNSDAQSLRLSDYYFKPGIIEKYENGLDAIFRGSVNYAAMDSDTSCSEEITNYLFKSHNETGIDLIAMDIQRGRDHGLSNYNEYRSICGLKRAECFNDLIDEIPFERIQLLKSLYEDVDDVDLFVGGSLELNVLDSAVGPTFQCIIGEQFFRTRVGDRYFYDYSDSPQPFTKEQIQEIKKCSMARLLCDNSYNLNKIQRRAFEVPGRDNPTYNCFDINKIPYIDLQRWKEF